MSNNPGGPIGPSKFSPEFDRQQKPENNAGCCGVPNSPDCDVASLATVGSALWEWEQVHGKLITILTKKLGADGRFYMDINRIACGPSSKRKSRKNCCALRYRVVR